jgi:flagellar biosynthesis/type III secretory pathway protein FliH
MRRSFLILEEATLSFSKKVSFPVPPASLKVSYLGLPFVAPKLVDEKEREGVEKGKKSATEFYSAEIAQIKDSLETQQTEILSDINDKAQGVLHQLHDRLPDLVVEMVKRILPGLELDANQIQETVRSLLSEFVDDEESLEVYLCKEDLALLKAAKKIDDVSPKEELPDEGFASAIAGIFDNLDGDDALLPDFPKVKFFEDQSLGRGDCQVKSRFGLLDGRISTKLRRIEEEMKGHG